jgi:hypothetical protein
MSTTPPLSKLWKPEKIEPLKGYGRSRAASLPKLEVEVVEVDGQQVAIIKNSLELSMYYILTGNNAKLLQLEQKESMLNYFMALTSLKNIAK